MKKWYGWGQKAPPAFPGIPGWAGGGFLLPADVIHAKHWDLNAKGQVNLLTVVNTLNTEIYTLKVESGSTRLV
jgi:hypothetical protein